MHVDPVAAKLLLSTLLAVVGLVVVVPLLRGPNPRVHTDESFREWSHGVDVSRQRARAKREGL